MLGIVITGAFSMDVPAGQRYVIIVPIAAILMALPLSEIYRWLLHAWPASRPFAVTGVVIIVLFIAFFDIDFYFNQVYEEYVLGGGNAQVALELAEYLQDQDEAEPIVYFFGWPRMGYYSIASLSYLAPHAEGIDINDPLTAAPNWELTAPTTFVFLPERMADFEWVQQVYPGGIRDEFVINDQIVLFTIYKYTPSAVLN
jgi:hypothetical protein